MVSIQTLALPTVCFVVDHCFFFTFFPPIEAPKSLEQSHIWQDMQLSSAVCSIPRNTRFWNTQFCGMARRFCAIGIRLRPFNWQEKTLISALEGKTAGKPWRVRHSSNVKRWSQYIFYAFPACHRLTYFEEFCKALLKNLHVYLSFPDMHFVKPREIFIWHFTYKV